MATHTAVTVWERGDAAFTDNRYSRAHEWRFDGGAVVRGSSSPHVVRVPLSDPAAVDPEEAFVAALSSCHLLWFLSLAAAEGFVVDRYEDHAEGIMGKNESGKAWVAKVVLRPRVTFAGPQPSPEAFMALHHRAHDECFIAASVKTEVSCEPTCYSREPR